jgi:hypothetical protein
MRSSQIRLLVQLGYPITVDFEGWYGAVRFQPLMIGLIVLAGTMLSSPAVFLVLSLVLLWSALVPGGNPFDVFYNTLVLRGRSRPLPPAPAPRRFAQALAGAFAAAMSTGWLAGARIGEAMLAIAVLVVLLRDACAGAVIYHAIAARARARRVA